ncbi:MAG: hypothetical protein IT460_16595 [Planctomycetes bacterium]|nr:hypothetical protein [Planctomycetota bacterium]
MPAPLPGCVLIVPPHDLSQNDAYVRFQPGTGRTWHGVRENRADVYFKEAIESSPPGPGPFALEVLAVEGDGVRLFRIHERSGRSWLGDGGIRQVVDFDLGHDDEEEEPPPPPDLAAHWQEVAELSSVETRTQALPASEAAPYFLRTAAKRDRAFLLRARRDTGQTWTTTGSGWTPVRETADPGPGRYDVVWAVGDKHPTTLLRFDAFSGRLWSAQPGRPWELVPEESGPAAPQAPPTPETARSPRYGWMVEGAHGPLAVTRFDASTGRMWIVKDTWMPFTEESEPPAADYAFGLIPGTDALPPLPFRWARQSGRLWLTPDGKRLTQLDAGKDLPGSRERFQIVAAARGRDVHVARLDRLAGAVAAFDGESALRELKDAVPVASGDYDLALAVSGSGRSFLMRLDRRSGRWWFAADGEWVPVRGLPEPASGSEAPRFSQRVLGAGEFMVAARFDERTGNVCQLEPDGDDPGRWLARTVPERRPPPPGAYVFGYALLGGEGHGTLASLSRMEKESGRVWVVSPNESDGGRTWTEVRGTESGK